MCHLLNPYDFLYLFDIILFEFLITFYFLYYYFSWLNIIDYDFENFLMLLSHDLYNVNRYYIQS